jgi:penicillin-binding protein 1A
MRTVLLPRRRLAALVAACGLLPACVSVPNISGVLARAQQAQTSVVYAADGSVLANLHAEIDRQVVPLTQIPKVAQDAVVAIEDERFRQHAGLDYRGIVRAFARDATSGRIVEGGSTITQQLVKNLLTGRETSLRRKIREALLARALEKEWTKDQILERYLNTVYFGRGAYGVEAAARTYFSEPASALTLPQAALLAGVIHAPSRFDPSADPAAATARRNVVIRKMRDLRWASARNAARALRAPLQLRPKPDGERYSAPYFVDYVKDLVFDGDGEFAALGATRAERVNALFKGGLRIYTTLDPRLQRTAEEAVRATIARRRDPYAAFVGMNPSDGAIVSMVGGRDFFDARDPFGKFNLAVRSRRQPGSAFKPFTLVAALENGISLDRVYRGGSHIALRLPGGGTWNPHNYEGNSFGSSLTLRRATALSVNVVYAQVVLDVGAWRVVDAAKRMGITSPLTAVPSIALGTEEVSPLEMADAYSTMANGGYRVAPMAIRKITDARGKTLWRAKVARARVISPVVTALATDALQDVMRAGTGRGLQTGFPVAGKTGTSDEYHDAWFAGFSPRYVGVTWVGYPRAQVPMVPPRTPIRVFGSSWPGEIWRAWMLEAHRGLVAMDFPSVDDILIRVPIDTLRNCVPNAYTPAFVVATKTYMRGREPKNVCTEPSSATVGAVPDVLGRDPSAARRTLMLAGLDARVVRRYCPAYRPGDVCDQTPAPGVSARVGDAATVFVSDDNAVASVPMVIGDSLVRARDTIERAGFTLAVERRKNSDAYTGCRDAAVHGGEKTWAQSPCADERYGRGATVTIYINP